MLLPVLAGCTDDELLQRSGVVEGIPTTVDINVGTAANTAKTRSALLESEERKIYDLYLWVFNASGDVEFSREYPRSDLYQAASDLEASTGEADGDAPTSMGLLKNISLTTGEKTLFLLANYKSDGDGLFHVEPDILEGIGKLSDVDKIKAAMTARTLFRPNGNLLMSVTKAVTVSTATRQIEVSLKRSEAKITVNLKRPRGSLSIPERTGSAMWRERHFLRNTRRGPTRAPRGMRAERIRIPTGHRTSSTSRGMPITSPFHSICPRTARLQKK